MLSEVEASSLLCHPEVRRRIQLSEFGGGQMRMGPGSFFSPLKKVPGPLLRPWPLSGTWAEGDLKGRFPALNDGSHVRSFTSAAYGAILY